MPTRKARSTGAPAARAGRAAPALEGEASRMLEGGLRPAPWLRLPLRGIGYASVPVDCAGALAELPLDAVAGLGSALCPTRPITTVEIACLKINCSWLLVSSTTEYLSNERMRPVSFTPLSR